MAQCGMMYKKWDKREIIFISINKKIKISLLLRKYQLTSEMWVEIII